MTVYEEQFKSKYNLPSREPNRYYIICYTPRSGSHLLGHVLQRTLQLGFPLEYFNPVNLEEWKTRLGTTGVEDTFREVKRLRTGSSGYFGCKMNIRQFREIKEYSEISDLISNPKVIFIRRKNIVKQAVSLVKAWQTGSYISNMITDKEMSYDKDAVNKAMRMIIYENAEWEYVIATRGWECLHMYYEDFVLDMEMGVGEVRKFLCGDSIKAKKESVQIPLPEKQRDDTSFMWTKKFLSDHDHSMLNINDKSIKDIFRSLIWRIVK